MKKILVLTLLFFNSLSADSTYSGIKFTSYEIQASLYLCNYYPKQTFKDLGFSGTDAKKIVNNRRTLYTSISQIDLLSGIGSSDLDKIKKQSHLIEWNLYTNHLGMTLHQTNFLYGLSGVLIGFMFMFGFIQVIITRFF